jgi:1-deoxy-D-xylulose-5-phosphate synthase
LGIPDIFVEHGPQTLLREKYGIDEKGIFKGVMEMFEEERLESSHSSQVETSLSRALPNPK